MGTVVAPSNSKKFKVGSRVWARRAVLRRLSATKSPPEIFPAMKLPGGRAAMLGALSLTTGITAYVGLFSVAKPPRKGHGCRCCGRRRGGLDRGATCQAHGR